MKLASLEHLTDFCGREAVNIVYYGDSFSLHVSELTTHRSEE
jgi:hypothetical protein